MSAPKPVPASDSSVDDIRRRRNLQTVALLRSWLEEDDESDDDQRAGLESLMRALDEDRTTGRKRFPWGDADGGPRWRR